MVQALNPSNFRELVFNFHTNTQLLLKEADQISATAIGQVLTQQACRCLLPRRYYSGVIRPLGSKSRQLSSWRAQFSK